MTQSETEIKHAQLVALYQQHSRAAVELYDAIYATVEAALGCPLPPGCTPLDAVRRLAWELDQLKTALDVPPPVGVTTIADDRPPTVVLEDDGEIQ